MKKIRFYHRWIYRIFYALWDPILRERPDLVTVIRDQSDNWLKTQAEERDRIIRERRKNIKVIK